MKHHLSLLAAASILVAACNSSHIDDTAPAFVGDTWVRSDGTAAAEATEGRWVLVEFFAPT